MQRGATKDCGQFHWGVQRWRPLQTTTDPVRSEVCAAASECISVEPAKQLLKGCPETGPRCRPSVIQPKVSGPNPHQVEEVQNLLDGTVRDWLQVECILSFLDYSVNYNNHGILDVTFRMSTFGVYPSLSVRHALLDLKTRTLLNAENVYRKERWPEFTREVSSRVKAAVQRAPVVPPGDYDNPSTPEFGALSEFIVTDKGLVFLFDYTLPHAMEAASPDSEILMNRQQLKPFLNPNGPLGWLLR